MSNVRVKTVDVAFVIDLEDETREVVAVMPAYAATIGRPNHCVCYVHTGHHGACDIDAIRHFYRDATPDEYSGLSVELNCVGYADVVVIPMDRIDCAEYTAARRKRLALFGMIRRWGL